MRTCIFRVRRLGVHAAQTAALLSLVLCLTRSTAWGAGYEKATTWSGRYAGMASAALSTVAGAESLYFNPAGLAGSRGTELSVNLSPTITELDGALPGLPGRQVWATGNPKTAPVAGVLASYGLGERWGIGLGYYVSGGLRAFYEDVDYGAFVPGAAPTVKADLAITEVGLGTAYELARGLKLGAAWRIVNVKADFSSVAVRTAGGTPVAVQNVHFVDLEDTSYSGFRVGAQYRAADGQWGLGASWRSRVRFTAEGNATGTIESAVPSVIPSGSLGSGTASVRNIFPQQIAIGAFYRESHNLVFVGEYAWTEYSDNSVLDVSGGLSGGVVGPVSLNGADIQQHWGNMSNIRFGVEYTGWGKWALRAGYIHTSRVTPSDFARATFSVPGEAHTVTLGLGRSWGEKLDWNLAFEYSFGNGYGSNAADHIDRAGFRSHALVAHSGVSYRF